MAGFKMDEVKTASHHGSVAFERVLPQLEGVVGDPSALTVNVLQAAMVADELADRLADPKLRQPFMTLGRSGFDVTLLDVLSDRAWAAWYARMRFESERAAVDAAKLPAEVVQQATTLRARMLAVVQYYLSGNPQLAYISKGTGYADLVHDLSRLAELYKEHEGRIRVDTVNYDPEDVLRANGLFRHMAKELQRAGKSDYELWRERQARAFALLRQTYDTLRAAAQYLFRNEPLLLAHFPSLVTASRKAARKNGGGNGEVAQVISDGAASPATVSSEEVTAQA